jgi:hypothetical protein
MTEYQLGSERPVITWLMISSRISASVRSKTASTSDRLMIPTSRPAWSTTGRRLTLRSYMSLAACSTISSGPIVTAGLVIRSGRRDSARLGPRGAVHDARHQSPDDVGLARHGLLDQQVRLGDDTGHFPCASRTGNALTRHSQSLAAISRNDALSLTHTGSADMTSLTVFILITLPTALYAQQPRLP